MPNLTFRSGLFFRTVLFYLLATALWTLYAIKWGKLAQTDDVRLPFGYLLILAISLVVGTERFRWDKVIALTAGVILIFLIATFAIGGMMITIHAPFWIYFIFNSAFVAFSMTWLISVWEDFPFRRWTILLTAVCMLFGYLLQYVFRKTLSQDYNIMAPVSMFLIVQTLLFIPLALGLAMKEEESNNEISQV